MAKRTAKSKPARHGGADLGRAALLVLAVLLVYARAPGLEFTSWDDDVNVTKNPGLNPASRESVLGYWRAPYCALYIPVTYTFLALEAGLSQTLGATPEQGHNPRIFHAGNLLLHALCVLLVYGLLLRLLERPSAALAGALLFALHPVQAESVAWVSETKGLLAALFGLSALYEFLRFREGRARSALHYALATLAFALALLAKPTAAALPLVAWLLDLRSSRRQAWRSAAALLPWLALAAALAVVTKRVQPDQVVLDVTPWSERPLVALDALGFYLTKVFWPVALGPDYGRFPARVVAAGVSGWLWILPLVLAALLVVLRRRLVLVAGGIFVAALLPVLGLVPFAYQYTSTVADRYVYLALLGPALALGAVVRRWPRRPVFAATGILLCVLGAASFRQTTHWRDDRTLFTHALHVNPTSIHAHNHLGLQAAIASDWETAIAHYARALETRPDFAPAWTNRGGALLRLGRVEEAIADCKRATEIASGYAEAHFRLAAALAAAGRGREAAAELATAHRLEPDDPDINFNLGTHFLSQGEVDRAEPFLRRAIESDPRFFEAHTQLAACLWQQGKLAEAAQQYRIALRIEPRSFETHRDLGKLLMTAGDAEGAWRHWREALALRPDDEEVRGYLDRLSPRGEAAGR
jgi:Flp pilus assembly protein TadD